MEKFFAPPETKGYVDIRYPFGHNLDMIRTVYGVPAHEINVVSMNRKTNAPIHEAARKFGANLQLIEAGDLMPSLLAITSPHENRRGIYIVAGRGGMEEGIIAAVGAKALNAHAQGREWRESPDNKDFPIPGGRVLNLDELVRGKREQSLVTFTPITWFDFPGVKFTNGSLDAQAVLLDMNGFQVIHHHKELGLVV
jgi:fructose-1,6-bisphosphatase/sedoheptulose 1,7-bisphosphatase-like protein